MKAHDTLDFTNRHQPFLPQYGWRALSLRVATGRNKLIEWGHRLRYRNELKRLLRVGPHMIKDVGLALEEAHREIEKPFWTP